MLTRNDLKSARSISDRIERRIEEVEMMDARAKRMTTRFLEAGGSFGSPQGDKIGYYVAEMDRMKAELQELVVEDQKKRMEIDRWIASLPYPLDKIANWRFLDGEKFIGWDRVGARLDRSGDRCRKDLWDAVDALEKSQNIF